MAEKPISLSNLKTFLEQIKSQFLRITGGTIKGNLRLQSDGTTYGNSLNFGDGAGAYIQEGGENRLHINGTAGVKLQSSKGEIALEAEDTINILSNGGKMMLNAPDGVYGNNAQKRIVRAAATLVAGTTKSGHTASDCDYICDGTADQTEIQNAINALPASGGKIVLLEGTYNLSGSININKPNVTIEGMGAGATVLQTASAIHMIHIQNGGSACRIKNLTVEKTGVLASGRAGIWIEGAQAEAVGVDASGFSYGASVGADEALITNSYLHDNGSGVYLGKSKAFVVDSLFKNNEVGVSLDGNYNVAENNRIIDNDIGIRISDYSKGHHNKFSGNYIIRGAGQATDYSTGQYTIKIESGTYNDVCDNYIMGKNYVNSGGTTNTFVNNKYQ